MGQDQARRPGPNPPGAPRVTGSQVVALAERKGKQVRKHDGCWWVLDVDGEWRTLGVTNYLAVQQLNVL